MSTYLVTGATGYIGSMVAEKLIEEGQDVILQVRSPEKLKEILHERARVITGDICNPVLWQTVPRTVDYVIHCAAPTKSAYMVAHPVETTDVIVQGTHNVLEFAKRCQGCKVLYLSSMEVYGDIDCSDGRRVTEEEMGYVNVFHPRSCYPIAKRMAEHMCFLYNKEYGVHTVIARLAQTFGRGVLASDTRVFAQFATSVREGTDIVLHTAGRSVGNYCDIDDVLAAFKLLLEKGEPGQAYNVVNESNTMTIREMAQMVAERVANGKIRVVYDIPEENQYGYAADTGLRLSGEKMRELGWEAETSLEQMYRNVLQEYSKYQAHRRHTE